MVSNGANERAIDRRLSSVAGIQFTVGRNPDRRLLRLSQRNRRLYGKQIASIYSHFLVGCPHCRYIVLKNFSSQQTLFACSELRITEYLDRANIQ